MSRYNMISGLAAAPALFLCALCACSVPLAGGLDDSAANQIVFTLDRASVDATKDVDPTADGRFRVTVARDDVARAISALADEGLPRSAMQGGLESVGKGNLVPSEAAEQAQLAAAIAGELERSLEGIQGVVSARVHISTPPPAIDKLSLPARSSASVLLQHRGSTPPVSADAVQRLVSGGVAGLSVGDVAVVMVSRPAPPMGAAGAIGHVGPIAVTRSSLRTLQGALVVLVVLLAGFATATLVLYGRLARTRDELTSPGARTPSRSP
jgi:type III secretion protein J